ncbi:hypothetical protein [Nannocystis punicea]|uniref:Uncharacterized protein n=1 Tax=Nannocystis punicea TaxID=2995304 RepID=A0ABY7GWP6_9BACT|nr:hypothetical protein [Nannocystis poenicansa]WAS91239.1 hypothetical protein O0S08_34050 [Nannocystis poenicansa]
MLDEQQVCEMVCAAVTPGDPAAGGVADSTVFGAMDSGDVQIGCDREIGRA